MIKQPGFIENLRKDLENNSDSIRKLINRAGGLSEQQLLSLLQDPQGQELQSVEVPADTEVSFYHDDLLGYEELGRQQSYVHCIYAGEVDPIRGTPKALTRVTGLGMSLLTIKLLQTPRSCETWIVVPPHFKNQIEDHISSLAFDELHTPIVIEQDSTYMLTPDYRLVKHELASCGSGGILAAMQRSGCLKNFSSNGGKYVYVTNVANVLATPSLEILGHHAKHGAKVTFEVVRRNQSDHGSILVESENGLNLVDPIRLPNVNLTEYTWQGVGSLVFDANIDISAILPAWRRVRRVYKNYLTVRYERFLEELSEAYTTNYVGVARNERFLRADLSTEMEEISKRLVVKFST